MRQFLRYQISGTVYELWLVIFFYSDRASDLNSLVEIVQTENENIKILLGLALALPVGVFIHQLSVLIKNWCVAKFLTSLSDYPSIERIKNINSEKVKYCLERISNLNSFYYVRFDNGFLAPTLAGVTVVFLLDKVINFTFILYALTIFIITMAYVPRIYSEIKTYENMIENMES